MGNLIKQGPSAIREYFEFRRRAHRAEAEVAYLRGLVTRLATELDAVPEKDLGVLALLEEAGVER